MTRSAVVADVGGGAADQVHHLLERRTAHRAGAGERHQRLLRGSEQIDDLAAPAAPPTRHLGEARGMPSLAWGAGTAMQNQLPWYVFAAAATRQGGERDQLLPQRRLAD